MMKLLNIFLLVLAFYMGKAQETPVYFKGATIYPVSGESIKNGVFAVQKGKIILVGKEGTIIPENAVVVDITGKVIMPGLVDTHSHLGGPDGGDNSSPLNPETRAMDAVNPNSDGFKKALAGGITTINVMPGSGHLMGGQTVYLKMREGKKIEDLMLVNEKGVTGGMKMANGTNPMRGNGGFPGTRAKSASLARELFLKAQEYKNKIDNTGKLDNEYRNLSERIARLEEKVNLILYTIKMKKDEYCKIIF
jgi:imidazolonepropionase-like amidohydrolase